MRNYRPRLMEGEDPVDLDAGGSCRGACWSHVGPDPFPEDDREEWFIGDFKAGLQTRDTGEKIVRRYKECGTLQFGQEGERANHSSTQLIWNTCPHANRIVPMLCWHIVHNPINFMTLLFFCSLHGRWTLALSLLVLRSRGGARGGNTGGKTSSRLWLAHNRRVSSTRLDINALRLVIYFITWQNTYTF
jgi:hypothetical protein